MAAIVRSEALVTDPKPTRELVIVETTHDGLRETWSPSDEDLASVGLMRIPEVPDLAVPVNGHAEESKP